MATETTFVAETTQYMLPDGRRVPQHIALDASLQPRYDDLRACDCRIAAEVLTTGDVSVTLEHEEGDYNIRVVPNDDSVRRAIEEMLREFDPARFRDWLALVTGGDE